MAGIKGFKVFNHDWTCRGFQYEVGKIYEEDVVPKVCDKGFHFCKEAKDCFNYYDFDSKNMVAEVIALGEVAEGEDKCSTNKIYIVREISWEELLTIVNIGNGNTGFCNSGDYNSGDYNSGNRNSGDYNSGNRNSGDCNSGNRNSGHYNSGCNNTGGQNSGHYNSGNRNSGNYNTGYRNSGKWNDGNYNSGDWNNSSHNTGCFNTKQHKLKFFDKETDMTFVEWRVSQAYKILQGIDYIKWIDAPDMTDEEKELNHNYKVTEGYLKVNNKKDACISWWDTLSEKEKSIIKEIPNFDDDKFLQITGINVKEG